MLTFFLGTAMSSIDPPNGSEGGTCGKSSTLGATHWVMDVEKDGATAKEEIDRILHLSRNKPLRLDVNKFFRDIAAAMADLTQEVNKGFGPFGRDAL